MLTSKLYDPSSHDAAVRSKLDFGGRQSRLQTILQDESSFDSPVRSVVHWLHAWLPRTAPSMIKDVL